MAGRGQLDLMDAIAEADKRLEAMIAEGTATGEERQLMDAGAVTEFASARWPNPALIPSDSPRPTSVCRTVAAPESARKRKTPLKQGLIRAAMTPAVTRRPTARANPR